MPSAAEVAPSFTTFLTLAVHQSRPSSTILPTNRSVVYIQALRLVFLSSFGCWKVVPASERLRQLLCVAGAGAAPGGGPSWPGDAQKKLKISLAVLLHFAICYHSHDPVALASKYPIIQTRRYEPSRSLIKPSTNNSYLATDPCPKLGLHSPQDRFTATQSGRYSGAAYFPEEHLLRGPIADVQGIFGRKNAREECARGVYKGLKALAGRTGLTVEEGIEEHPP